jgi:hypothetical protein
MRQQDGSELTSEVPLLNYIGRSNEKSPRVQDGPSDVALLNEPNGCWAKVV